MTATQHPIIRARAPGRISVLDASGFRALIESQPWSVVRGWQDTWYRYAVCEKGLGRDGI